MLYIKYASNGSMSILFSKYMYSILHFKTTKKTVIYGLLEFYAPNDKLNVWKYI